MIEGGILPNSKCGRMSIRHVIIWCESVPQICVHCINHTLNYITIRAQSHDPCIDVIIYLEVSNQAKRIVCDLPWMTYGGGVVVVPGLGVSAWQ